MVTQSDHLQIKEKISVFFFGEEIFDSHLEICITTRDWLGFSRVTQISMSKKRELVYLP